VDRPLVAIADPDGLHSVACRQYLVPYNGDGDSAGRDGHRFRNRAGGRNRF
jgi:hypothetical protein